MNKKAENKTKYFTLNRKIVGYKTHESWVSVPHVTFVYEADATDLLAEFYLLRKNRPETGLSLNTLLLKICVEAIKAAPQVNAVIKFNPKYVTGQIDVQSEINISTPWLLENGDMANVNLRGFESKSLGEMQEYLNKTAAKIKSCDIYIPMYQVSVNNMLAELKKGRLLKAIRALVGAAFGNSRTRKPAKKDVKAYKKLPDGEKITVRDLEPGTVTISNLGSVYKAQKGFMGILEIVPPQVFAVGLGGVQEKAGVVADANGEKIIAVRKILPMCLAFDHRALNFDEIVPFMQKLDYIFEHAELLHEWI